MAQVETTNVRVEISTAHYRTAVTSKASSASERKVPMIALALLALSAAEDYDLLVVGGGSGGIACAREAAALGARVCVADYVRPSPAGSRWGLGGTCVNVGCIPKKLMHRAAQLGEMVATDAPAYGWRLEREGADGPGRGTAHDWRALVKLVQGHIKSLNFGYRTALAKEGVTYLNRRASFRSATEVALADASGDESLVRAKHVVLAVGGRPNFPDGFAGAAARCISSDDLFSLTEPPGKTLVVGGSYVALECAGLLRGLGFEVTLLMRSIPLRGFDVDCARRVLEALKDEGVEVRPSSEPASIHAILAPTNRWLDLGFISARSPRR